MNTSEKSEFARMCRELRIEKGLKQREVADAIGVKPSTYGNVECSKWKVIGSPKVARLVKLYSLPPGRASELSAAWEAVPLSPYAQKVRDSWRKRNAIRSSSKMVPVLQLALVETLSMLIAATDGDPSVMVCRCGFDGTLGDDSGRACELCEAFNALGLTWTTREKAIDDLGKLGDRLEAGRAAKTAS